MSDDRPIGEDDLQAFVDGRLAPGRLQAVEAYLAQSPDAAADVARQAELREALRTRPAFKAREPVPARLRVANLAQTRPTSPFRAASVAAAIGWLALGLSAGAAGGAWWASARAAPEPRVAEDAIAAYRTYVGERLHPVEVAADQEAHLVQWLSRRLGKPLAAPDLNAQGYRLIGGRLLPAGAEPAALFMYEDAQGGRLTLYARAGSDAQTSFRFESHEGVSAFSWMDNGLSYAVSARTDRPRLLTIAEAIYRQFETAPAQNGGRL